MIVPFSPAVGAPGARILGLLAADGVRYTIRQPPKKKSRHRKATPGPAETSLRRLTHF